MPNPITKEEAQEILSPYLKLIQEAVTEAVNNYYSASELTPLRAKLSKRSHASNCHDLVVSAIIERFEREPGTRCFYKKNLFLLSIKGRIVLRFKMFDHNLMSHGIQTKQMHALSYQDVSQLEFDDMPPDGLLHVGYRLNALHTGVEKVYITYRYGNFNVWDWDITQTQQSNVEQIQFTQQTNTKPAKRKPKLKTNNVGDMSESI